MTKPLSKPIEQRAAAGEYSLIEPFDYLILGLLPDQGTLFAGLYPLGETALNLGKKMPKTPDKKNIPSSQIQARLRSLTLQGLVIKGATIGRGGKAIWQRTPRGADIYKAWQGAKNGSKRNDG